MKTGAILAVVLGVVSLSHFANGASVGPTGYTNDFSSQPSALDWATSSQAGSSVEAYNPDTDVNASVNAGNVNAQLSSSTGDPPVQAGLANWSSTGLYIQTRPTGNRYTLLIGKFVNDTGTNATEVALSYRFTIAAGGTPEDTGKGNRLYYSFLGLPGTWVNVAGFNTTESTNSSSVVATNLAVAWTNGSSLYLLWLDDNAGGSTFDAANQIDDFSLQVAAGTPLAFTAAMTAPTNNAVFVSGIQIGASAAVAYGAAPYSVEFFTNSGAGNTVFASAGSASGPPFQLSLGALPRGTYNIYAVASDGAASPANAVSLTNTFVIVEPLAAMIDTPADGAIIEHLTPVVSAVNVTGGTAPYSVQFYLDGVASAPPLIAPPYERNFGTLFVGDHTVRASVTDARGWASNSAVHTMHITGPLAVMFAPTNGAVFTYGQQVGLNASIGGGTPPHTATFYTNGYAAGAVGSAPFVLNLGTLPVGTYTSYVHVIDSDSTMPAEVISETNVFTVLPSNLFVALSNPQDGAAVLEGRTSTFSGSAAVSAPLILVRVEFYYDDVLAGADTTSPYSVTVTNNVDGIHRVYMVAVDSLGRRAYSVTNRLIVVDNTPAPNDNFNNAIAFSGPVAVANSHNNGATKEPGEPNHAANNTGGGSLWWTWTPSTSGPATIDTFGSDFDTLLGVYTGNAVNQLTVIAQNDDASGLQSRVQFNATAGTLYRVAVDGYSGGRGLIHLNIRGAGGVELSTPTNGMLTVVGDPITVSARILPDFPNPPASRVEFYRGGVLFASVTNEQFSVVATNVPTGSNSFYVVAVDSQGTRLQSSTATVFVQAIGVMILSPFANTTFSTTNPITIQTWAYLPEGAITNVDFFVDAVRIGGDGTSPFSIVWTNVTPGSHRLTAVGRSDRGTSYTSAGVNIGVMGTLVPNNAIWRYRDDGSNQGTNWRRLDFDDSAWPSGPAPLGFGDSGGRFPATTNAGGAITYYYRYSFVVTNPPSLSFLNSTIERDDGTIVYLNGTQVYFDFNMPSGTVGYTDYALSTAFDDGTAAWGFGASVGFLRQGTNVVAVEVHQAVPGDSDLWFRLTMTAAPIIIQNVPPLVSIINPTNNQYFLAPSSISIEAEASDVEGPVRLVEFFANGVKIGEATNAPFAVTWSAPAVGDYVLTAQATDSEGARTTSSPVPIVIYDVDGTPLARITSPTNGAVMEGPTNLLVTAVAHAIAGVTNVQFLANGEVFDEDNSEPYSAIWTAPFGTNLLTAIVFDANGVTGTSAVVTVTITIPPTNVIAPAITTQFPVADSTITNLSSITVRFSEYVQNLDAADLLINGVPATSVDASHSRSNFTFTFPQPPYGEVRITWATGHGITDYGWPTVLPFDESLQGASWTYTLVDRIPPTIAARVPAPASSVSNVAQITVTFSEDVSGVDAADLRVNGAAALQVTGNGSTYVFRVAQPPPGNVAVTWATNHNIFDLATIPNAFNGAASGAAWNFTLDNRTVLVQSNSFWRFVKGTNEPSIPMQAWRQPAFDDSGWSNSPAPFYYGDPYNTPQIPGTLLNDMLSRYSTIYLRTTFNVANRSLITNLWLNAQSDDGFKLWLNGVEIHRYNAPASEVPYNGVATAASPEPQNRGAAYILTSLPDAVSALVDGINVLAVHALNQSLSNSSDFGFNAQLYTYLPDLATIPPYLLTSNPSQGDVFSFTNVTITFSEPVSGVDATDLLVNGVPATAISTTTNTTYTFTFAQPPFGPVVMTWDANHGIADFDDPPRAFDRDAPTSILNYYVINPSSPRILTQAPLAGSSLTGLTTIVVTFTEPVVGVDAADLLINGTPATSMTAMDDTNFLFAFAQPPFGLVTIRWAANQGIADVEAGNAFDGARFGAQWDYILINPAPSVTLTSPTNGAYRLPPATVSFAATASDYDGTVQRIAFYANGTLVGISTNAPFGLVWSNISLGMYFLTAVATDNSGLMGTSAPVVLNVVTSLPAALVRGPYLQVGTPISGIVRWRTDVPTDGLVCYGTDPLNLTNFAAEITVTNEHIVQLTGLRPSTKYHYSIGSAALRLAGTNGIDSEFWFKTSPPTGTVQPTRLWVLGDPGTAGIGSADRQNRTRDAFYTFAANSRPPDLWLMLGDNAYNRGEDDEYQRAVFDIYPATLRNVFLWTTLGNHETAQSFTATDFPYLHIFSLPQNGEAGGVPSGTEKYYSFDYANIHFVCLDSMSSGQNADSPMAEWLRADLASAVSTWVIAFFHHPPYTKGNHDSDRERELIDIRANLLPILEDNGVDLVLNGHSHAWERSYLLHGHYGLSSTLTESMKVDPGNGREDGTGPYRKNLDGHGVVYTVAGNAGQVTGGSLDHPAHYVSFNDLGTMVIDVQGNRLDATFLREDGQIPDHFTIFKPDPRPDAPLHLLALPSAPAEVTLSWTDVSTNELGFVIERSIDGTNFAEHIAAPANAVTALDTGLVDNIIYFYRVRATNAVGPSDYSNIASITAVNASAPPQPPANLVASAREGSAYFRSRIVLHWTDASDNEAGFLIERSRDGSLFMPVLTIAANSTAYTDTGLQSSTVYAYRVRAINALGQSAATSVASDQTHPRSHEVSWEDSAVFQAGIEGAPSAHYQWRFNNTPIPGETNDALMIPAADLQHQGEYSVVIIEGGRSETAGPATLSVRVPPRIVRQPQDLVRAPGMTATFDVIAEGSVPLTYRWRRGAQVVGGNSPLLTLSNVQLSDQDGYDVVIENSYGTMPSRVATLMISGAPSLVQVPDLFAEVLRPLFLTNVTIDPNIPPLDLRFTLASDAPTNAHVNPRTGFFYWTPNRAQAPGTNGITIKVFDQEHTALSNSMTFTVRVNDYVEVTAGSLVMLAGTNGAIPLRVFSSVELAQLQCMVGFNTNYFSSFAADALIPQRASVAFQPVDPNSARLTVTPTAGNTLIGADNLVLLRFAARPQTNSAAVPLRVSDLQVTPLQSGSAPTLLTTDGRVMMIGTTPFLDAHINAAGQRELTIYGQPANYTLQFSTNLADPQGWRMRAFVRVSNNLERAVNVTSAPTNTPVFFRVRQ